jgi:cytochrome P450
MHTHPRYWGEDSLEWKPQRWISGSGSLESEELLKPLKGTYFPWSEGIRNCPGKKFAQVEFVATLATLLKNHVAEPVAKRGESLNDARRRTMAVVEDSGLQLLLQMRDPRSVAVSWKERQN